MLCCRHYSMLSTILFNIVAPDSGLTILFIIVDNIKQCWQQNIVQPLYNQSLKAGDFLPGRSSQELADNRNMFIQTLS